MLTRTLHIISFLFIFTSLSSCVDEYFPNVDKYEGLLVVDGLLTDEINSAEIILSLSSPVNEAELIPLSGAEVFLLDEYNLRTNMKEASEGRYVALDSTFKANAGESYKLHISLSNGREYESELCTIIKADPIDSLYAQAKNAGEFDEDVPFPGLQFYVSNHQLNNDTSYYVWKLYQTYHYRSTFDIDYTWEGELISNPNATELRDCWITDKLRVFLFDNTTHLDYGQINIFPLNYVTTNTKQLSIRYSLLVKQLNISSDAYFYYASIDEQNKDQGNMWSRQPLQIVGNIKNIDDDQESVLGFFITAGVSEKRIFVNRPNLPFYYYECEPDFEGMRFIEFEPEELWPIYIDDIMFLGLARAQFRSCFDCRLDGGDLDPPDFWTEY